VLASLERRGRLDPGRRSRKDLVARQDGGPDQHRSADALPLGGRMPYWSLFCAGERRRGYHWRTAVLIPSDEELTEQTLKGVAYARTRNRRRTMATLIKGMTEQKDSSPGRCALMRWTARRPAIHVAAAAGLAQLTVFNRVTVGNGLRGLEVVVQAGRHAVGSAHPDDADSGRG